MRINFFCPMIAALWFAACSGPTAIVRAAEEPAKPQEPVSAGPVSFFKEVRPILQANCIGCHQPARKGGDYVMTDFAALLKGGEGGSPAVTPGKVNDSDLLAQIKPKDGKAAMPKNKPPLNETQIALITRWIEQGAKDDTPASARQQFDMQHPPAYELPPVITSLDFSPDGKLLAVSGYHEVLLHKSDGSEIVARFVGLSERIEKVRFSPDGKWLAVAGGSPGRMGELQIWDVEGKKLKLSIPATYDTVYGACWSPDGKLVSIGCADNTARVFNTESGEQVFTNMAHNDWALDTAFSLKGDHVVSVSRDRSLKLYELGTQRFIDNVTSITPGALKGGLASVARHPTKEEVLIGGADGVAKIYKIFRTSARQIGDDSNKIRFFPAMNGRIFSVAYSRDGKLIVAGSGLHGQGEVRVFDADKGTAIAKMQNQPCAVHAVAFSPDAAIVAAGGFDGQVRLFEAATGKPIKTFSPVPLTPAAVGQN